MSAGYGHELYVVLYTMILPYGYCFAVYSIHFFITLTFFLSILPIVPSFLRFSPNIDAIAIGNLNNLGITPLYIKLISLSSYSPIAPHASATIK